MCCAIIFKNLRTLLFASNVANLGDALFAMRRSVLRFDGLLAKIFVLNVRMLLNVAVPGDLCVNIHLANALPGLSADMIFASNNNSLPSMAKIRICRLEPVYNACETTT